MPFRGRPTRQMQNLECVSAMSRLDVEGHACSVTRAQIRHQNMAMIHVGAGSILIQMGMEQHLGK